MKSIVLLALLVFAVKAQTDIDVHTSGRIAEHTPYHCLIQVDLLNPVFQLIYAGAIISPKHVITSAHVLWNHADFYVGVGSNRKDQLIYYAIQSWHVHPYYLHVNKRWSFGVVVLQHSLTFNSFVQPVALPPLGVHGPLWNEQGHVSSYALDTGILKTAYQRINNDTDEYMEQDTQIWGEYEEFNGEQQCIDIAGGAAFIVRHFGVDTIMGLSISGENCLNNYPAVYARVTKGREWIHEEFGI